MNGSIYKNLKIKSIIVTLIIIALNVGVFIFQEVNDLDPWDTFGISIEYLESGEYYRILTCFFAHGSFFHIFFNMLSLFAASVYLEPALGNIWFSVLYMLSGILSSISGTLLGAVFGDYSCSVGASGAIFALFGLIFAFSAATELLPLIDKTSIILLIAISLDNSVGAQGVDLFGHVGGLLTGLVLGLIFSFFFVYRNEKLLTRNLSHTQLAWRNEYGINYVRPGFFKTFVNGIRRSIWMWIVLLLIFVYETFSYIQFISGHQMRITLF